MNHHTVSCAGIPATPSPAGPGATLEYCMLPGETALQMLDRVDPPHRIPDDPDVPAEVRAAARATYRKDREDFEYEMADAADRQRQRIADLVVDGLVAVARKRGFADVKPTDDEEVFGEELACVARPLSAGCPPDLQAVAALVWDVMKDGFDPGEVARAAPWAIQAGMSIAKLRPVAERLVCAVRPWAEDMRSPPLTASEVDVFVAAFERAPVRREEVASTVAAEAKPAEAQPGQVEEDDWDDYAEGDEQEDKRDYFAGITLPGLGGAFVDYVKASAHRVLPTDALALAASIGLFSTVIGNRRRTESGARSNPFMLVTAGSSVGKNAPQSCIARTAAAAGVGARFMAGDFTSSAALYRRLQQQPVTGWICDEAGIMLKAACDPKADAIQASKIGALLEAFSHCEAEWQPRSYSKADDTITVRWPVLSALLFTTGSTLWSASVTQEQVSNGFFGRFMLFPGPESAEGLPHRAVAQQLPPVVVVDAIKGYCGGSALATLAEVEAGGLVVTVCDEAQRLADAFAADCDRRAFEAGSALGLLWQRAREKVDQVLLPVTFMRDPAALVASADDMRLAISIVEAGTRSLMRAAGRDLMIHGSESEVRQRTVLRPIRASGRQGITGSALLRATGLYQRQVDEAVQTLLAARRIEVEEVVVVRKNGSGAMAKRYRLRVRKGRS